MAGKQSGPNPTDRAKKGVKRNVLTETHGVPIGLEVQGANRNDYKMMRETLESIPVKRPKPTRKKPQGVNLDKGYDYDEVRDLAIRPIFLQDPTRIKAHIFVSFLAYCLHVTLAGRRGLRSEDF